MVARVPLLLLLLVLPSSAPAVELVTNGGFEEGLPPAWLEDLGRARRRASVGSTGHDGDPDYEVLVEKGTGNGHAQLNQTVAIPSTDVELSVNARCQVAASDGGPWAAAGVAISYEDHFGNALGATIILRMTTTCPWTDGDTLHLVLAPDETWHSYGFNVASELTNLPGSTRSRSGSSGSACSDRPAQTVEGRRKRRRSSPTTSPSASPPPPRSSPRSTGRSWTSAASRTAARTPAKRSTSSPPCGTSAPTPATSRSSWARPTPTSPSSTARRVSGTSSPADPQ